MSVLHKNVSDPDIHEPKGCSSATAKTCYIADGVGSGSWSRINNIGEMYISSNKTVSLTAAADSTLETNSQYIKLNATGMWSGGVTDGVTYDTTNGELVITRDGAYELSFWISQYIDGSTNRNLAFKYAVNGNLSDRKVVSSSYFGGQYNSVSSNGFVNLVAGDKISLYVACTGSATLTITDATFIAKGKFA